MLAGPLLRHHLEEGLLEYVKGAGVSPTIWTSVWGHGTDHKPFILRPGTQHHQHLWPLDHSPNHLFLRYAC